MFTTVLGKKCLQNKDCHLHGQMQDAGLPLCPECACELTPVTRINPRAVLAVAVAALLLTSASSALAYGVVVKRFTPWQTVKWLSGQVKRVDRLGFGEEGWLTGNVAWWHSDGTARPAPAQYLYERVNSQHRFRPEFTAERNDWLRFELTPKADYAYVVYRAPDQPQVLFSPKQGRAANGPILVPTGPSQAIMLNGPAATEHFILIASRKPVTDLDDSKTAGSGERIDEIVAQLEKDPDNAAVYHVMIPHK